MPPGALYVLPPVTAVDVDGVEEPPELLPDDDPLPLPDGRDDVPDEDDELPEPLPPLDEFDEVLPDEDVPPDELLPELLLPEDVLPPVACHELD